MTNVGAFVCSPWVLCMPNVGGLYAHLWVVCMPTVGGLYAHCARLHIKKKQKKQKGNQ